jgi:hypothetical protein
MAKTIGQLTELTPASAVDGADLLPISDSNVTKKVSVTNLLNTAVTFSGTKTLAEAANIAVGTGTGTKIGTDPLQKLGFFDATPVARAASTADLKDAFCALGFMSNGGASPLNLDSGALTCGALTAGAATATSLASTGAVTSSSATAGVGYATGAGGTVQQATNKSTGVTLNNVCGTIALSTENDNISSSATKTFTLTNSTIDAGDLLVLNHVSGGTAGAYALNAQCGADSASINVTNISSSGKNENNVVIRFAVIKAVTA